MLFRCGDPLEIVSYYVNICAPDSGLPVYVAELNVLLPSQSLSSCEFIGGPKLNVPHAWSMLVLVTHGIRPRCRNWRTSTRVNPVYLLIPGGCSAVLPHREFYNVRGANLSQGLADAGKRPPVVASTACGA